MLKMKTIETPWLKLSRFLGIGFGIPFTLLGIFLYFNYSNTAFLINGILWLGVALILLLKGKWDEHLVYLLSPWDKSENLHIIIYVSKNNKNRYAVVAFRKEDIFEA